jgi:hypothetical protein
LIVHERLTEALKDVGRGDAVLRVLDAEPEDLFSLTDVPEANTRRAEQAEPLGDWR